MSDSFFAPHVAKSNTHGAPGSYVSLEYSQAGPYPDWITTMDGATWTLSSGGIYLIQASGRIGNDGGNFITQFVRFGLVFDSIERRSIYHDSLGAQSAVEGKLEWCTPLLTEDNSFYMNVDSDSSNGTLTLSSVATSERGLGVIKLN